MKHFKLLFASLCVSAFITTAQAQNMQIRAFRPVAPLDYAELKGIPYLYEDWQGGNVTFATGESNKEKLLLKYNLVNDMLSFKENSSNEEMAFVEPVKEFTIIDASGNEVVVRRFRNGYHGITGTTPESFFEVLSDGKTQLLKKHTKMITESMHVGASGMTRSFTDKTKYYLVSNGKVVAVKNNETSLLNALSDKVSQLEQFIKTYNTDFKKDAQIGKLVDYYNTLQVQQNP